MNSEIRESISQNLQCFWSNSVPWSDLVESVKFKKNPEIHDQTLEMEEASLNISYLSEASRFEALILENREEI